MTKATAAFPIGSSVGGMEDLLALYHDRLAQRLEDRLERLQDEVIARLTMSMPSHPPAVVPPFSACDVCLGEGVDMSGLAVVCGGARPNEPRPLEDKPSRPSFTLVDDDDDVDVIAGSRRPSIALVENEDEASLGSGALEQVRHGANSGSKSASVDRPAVHDCGGVRSTSQESAASTLQSCSGKGSFAQRLVEDYRFDLFFGVAIMANVTYLGVQTDTMARTLPPYDETSLDWIGIGFAFLFIFELSLRIFVKRFTFFVDPKMWRWNMLDLFITASFLAEVGAVVAWNVSDAPAGMGTVGGFRILRILRICRLLRVIRVARIIRSIRALRTMLFQLANTVRPLICATVLFMMILYVFAIVFTQAFAIHRLQSGDTSPELWRQWSTLPRSMLTLFQAISGGISWQDCLGPLSDLGAWQVALFIGYVAFIHFAVLNILTGVFCQNAIENAAHDQEIVSQQMLAQKHMYVRNMQHLFQEFDSDNSGSVTITEFMSHLDDEDVQAYFDSLELDTSDVRTLFRMLDKADQHELDLEDFVSGCMRLKGGAKNMDIAKLSYAQSALSRRLARFMDRTDKMLVSLSARLEEQRWQRDCAI